MEGLTSRQKLKGLLRGEAPLRPLLIPGIFALGSRLENLPLPDFLGNPTKIANALRQIRAALKVDGVMCYGDPSLEAEALGVKVEWRVGESRMLTTHVSGGFREVAPQVLRMGRIPVALAVLERLKTMLRDETALMMRVTGPHTLARQIDDGSSDIRSVSAQIVADLVKGYLEGGADVIFLEEDTLPTEPVEQAGWKSSLDPIINVIRFYESLPVLRVAADRENGGFLAAQSWDCGVCITARLAEETDFGTATPWLGVDLPLSDLTNAPDPQAMLTGLPGKGASFLSSLDPPRDTDVKRLTRVLTTVRNQLQEGG